MRPYPAPYIAYLVEFHATRDYFECHELLEDYWKAHPNDGFGDLWVGLIQLAVGQYHERRGNRRGAGMMYEQSLTRLERADLSGFGLHRERLISDLHERLSVSKGVHADGNADYRDLYLPIEDARLRQLCEEECRRRGIEWGIASQMEDERIVQRHILRDRSDVAAAREAALKAKNDGRE